MADLLRQGRYADEIIQLHAASGTRHGAAGTKVSSNDPCPRGSGKKFKHCHGRAEGVVTPPGRRAR